MRIPFILILLALFTLAIAMPTAPHANNTAPAVGATTYMVTINAPPPPLMQTIAVLNSTAISATSLQTSTIAVIDGTATPATSPQTRTVTSITVTATSATSPQTPIIATIIVTATPATSPQTPAVSILTVTATPAPSPTTPTVTIMAVIETPTPSPKKPKAPKKKKPRCYGKHGWAKAVCCASSPPLFCLHGKSLHFFEIMMGRLR